MQMLKIYTFLISTLILQKLYANKDPFLLAQGKNRDLVIQNCMACHSERLIVQNHMGRKQWDEKITWMQKTQNLWPLAKELRSKILDYLETTQGPLASQSAQDRMDNLGPRSMNPLLFEKKKGL